MNCLCPEPIGNRHAPQHCEWRPIAETDDRYWVSDEGDVWGPYGLMSQHYGAWEFKQVAVKIKGRFVHRAVHRMVALAFIGPRTAPNQYVGFRDNNKDNCAAANLHWTSERGWAKYRN